MAKFLDNNGLLYYDQKMKLRLQGKQDTLVGTQTTGQNIKTINGQTILGTGDIEIQGGGDATNVKINGTSITSNNVADIKTQGTYNASTNKIATMNDVTGQGYITGITNSDVVNALGFTPYNATNPSGYQTESEVDDKIASAISATYKASGSIAFENLPTLAETNLGKVYNITTTFTTTADFVEGAGNSYPAGTNVAIVQVNNAYKYDVMAGFVDLSSYYNNTNLIPITNAEIDTIIAS